MPRRTRRSRKDASIASTTATIAKLLNLPYMSIRFVSPSGRRIRSTATIGALRRIWE